MAHQAATHPWKRIHDLAGVLVKDLWRYAPALLTVSEDHRNDARWIGLRNRNEVLEQNPAGRGVHCRWTWSSELHACKVVPALGQRLMRVALSQWPIRFATSPVSSTGPTISYVFAHDGIERLPHLQNVIRTIFAQRDVQVEVVVIDLSPEGIGSRLPPEVVYVHVETNGMPAGWRKAWAFNIAARRSRGEFLVFQDGDVCVPERYSLELLAAFDQGFDAVSIHRFLFYIDQAATQRVFETGSLPATATPARVLQNFKGGTIATRRTLFFDIGGFDEGFVGWGGEDDEFYDRCAARRHCQFGYLPFVHLWHPPQPDRIKPDNFNTSHVLPERLSISRERRIVELRNRNFGSVEGPDPAESYKTQYLATSAVAP